MNDSGMPSCAEASGANGVAGWGRRAGAAGLRGAGELTRRGRARSVPAPVCVRLRAARSCAAAGARFDLTFVARLARGAGVAVGWGEAVGSAGDGDGAGAAAGSTVGAGVGPGVGVGSTVGSGVGSAGTGGADGPPISGAASSGAPSGAWASAGTALRSPAYSVALTRPVTRKRRVMRHP